MLKTFLIQTYIFTIFNCETAKVILFSKINRFLVFTFNDTWLDTNRFDKKINFYYTTRFKFCLSFYPLWYSPALPLKRM